jgi:hypothetical protein
VSAAHRAFEAWSETTPMERSRLLLKLADAIEARAADFARLESLNCGKPYAARARRRDPGHRRLLPLLRRRGALHERHRSANEYLPGHTSMIRRDARRRGRLDRAVELPADDGRLEDRPGARRRQHRGAQAERADAAHLAAARRSSRPRSFRRACST